MIIRNLGRPASRLARLLVALAVALTAVTAASTPSGAAVTCSTSRSYDVWPGGLMTTITVWNTGDTPSQGWSLRVLLARKYVINQVWYANFVDQGMTSPGSGWEWYQFTNESWNGRLGPGQAASMGFIGSFEGPFPYYEAGEVLGVACSLT